MIQAKVWASSNGGHSPETIAEMCVSNLIHVADSAPPELAMQARALREQMLDVILQHVILAVNEDRRIVRHQLERAGLSEAAQNVRSI